MEPTWIERKKHEWLYKVEMARHRRAAAKNSRQREKAQELAERQAQGVLTLSQRWQNWLQDRAVRKELRAARWRERPAYAWLKEREVGLFWLFSLCLVGVFCGYVVIAARKSDAAAKRDALAKRAIVTINGKVISADDVVDRAFYAHGASVIQELIEQEVVRQEADRQKVKLTSDDLAEIAQLAKKSPIKPVLQSRLETTYLLRNLVLRTVTDEQRRAVFRDFKEDVTIYSVSAVTFSDINAARNFQSAVKGGEAFSSAAMKYSVDGAEPVKLGELAPAKLDKRCGRRLADTIMALQPGSTTDPIKNRNGEIFIYRLDWVKSEYRDVVRTIDDMIVDAKSPQFLFDLMSTAKIDSPYINRATSDLTDDAPTPAMTATPRP